MEKIQNIIPQVIAHLSEEKPGIRTKISDVWHRISAGKMAKHTSIAGLQKGTLLINVDSPAWLFQMNLQKRKVLEQLQKAIPELSQIRFKIGKVK